MRSPRLSFYSLIGQASQRVSKSLETRFIQRVEGWFVLCFESPRVSSSLAWPRGLRRQWQGRAVQLWCKFLSWSWVLEERKRMKQWIRMILNAFVKIGNIIVRISTDHCFGLRHFSTQRSHLVYTIIDSLGMNWVALRMFFIGKYNTRFN